MYAEPWGPLRRGSEILPFIKSSHNDAWHLHRPPQPLVAPLSSTHFTDGRKQAGELAEGHIADLCPEGHVPGAPHHGASLCWAQLGPHAVLHYRTGR